MALSYDPAKNTRIVTIRGNDMRVISYTRLCEQCRRERHHAKQQSQLTGNRRLGVEIPRSNFKQPFPHFSMRDTEIICTGPIDRLRHRSQLGSVLIMFREGR